MRENANQIEIAAGPLRIDRATGHLHFTGGIRERAVFFVGGGGGENNVGALSGVGQEHIVNDEQVEARYAIGCRNTEGLDGIGANHVESVQLSSCCCVQHGARGQPR